MFSRSSFISGSVAEESRYRFQPHPCLMCEQFRSALDTPHLDAKELHFAAAQKEDSFCKIRKMELDVGKCRTRIKFYFHQKSQILYRRVELHQTVYLAAVVPLTLRRDLMFEYHDGKTGGHRGINATLEAIRPKYWWHKLKLDVIKFINGCEYCQRTKMKKTPKLPMTSTIKSLPVTELKPFQMMGIDIVVFDRPSTGGVRYVIVCVCLLTKYTVTKAVKCMTAQAMVKFLFEEIICMVSVPEIMISDRGKQLTSEVFTGYCQEVGIQNRFTARYHPQSNGIVERRNQELKLQLKHLVGDNHQDWARHLRLATFMLNTAVSSSTGYSPYYLVFGQHPIMPVDRKSDREQLEFRPDPDNPTPVAKETRMKPIWDRAFKKLLHAADRVMKRIKPPKIFPHFVVGDQVWLTKFERTMGRVQGFCDAYIGPFLVIHRESPTHYVVQDPDKPSDIRTCHVAELKKVIKRPPIINYDFSLEEKKEKGKPTISKEAAELDPELLLQESRINPGQDQVELTPRSESDQRER